MKKIAFVCFVFFYFFQLSCSDKRAKKNNFQNQIGTYILDINKTKLSSYRTDSNLYKKLEITFNKDSTFHMNMRVPFLFDSCGIWNTDDGSAYVYNQLFFKNFKYNKETTGDHFFSMSSKDSTFLLNNSTPRKGEDGILEIYFRKIHN